MEHFSCNLGRPSETTNVVVPPSLEPSGTITTNCTVVELHFVTAVSSSIRSRFSRIPSCLDDTCLNRKWISRSFEFHTLRTRGQICQRCLFFMGAKITFVLDSSAEDHVVSDKSSRHTWSFRSRTIYVCTANWLVSAHSFDQWLWSRAWHGQLTGTKMVLPQRTTNEHTPRPTSPPCVGNKQDHVCLHVDHRGHGQRASFMTNGGLCKIFHSRQPPSIAPLFFHFLSTVLRKIYGYLVNDAPS